MEGMAACKDCGAPVRPDDYCEYREVFVCGRCCCLCHAISLARSVPDRDVRAAIREHFIRYQGEREMRRMLYEHVTALHSS